MTAKRHMRIVCLITKTKNTHAGMCRVIKKLCASEFFLWGAMKNSVYSNNPHTIDDLKMVFTDYIRNADRAILNTVFENSSACQ
jgi:hypothetical protein